jgi:hypothetical protein
MRERPEELIPVIWSHLCLDRTTASELPQRLSGEDE